MPDLFIILDLFILDLFIIYSLIFCVTGLLVWDEPIWFLVLKMLRSRKSIIWSGFCFSFSNNHSVMRFYCQVWQMLEVIMNDTLHALKENFEVQTNHLEVFKNLELTEVCVSSLQWLNPTWGRFFQTTTISVRILFLFFLFSFFGRVRESKDLVLSGKTQEVHCKLVSIWND